MTRWAVGVTTVPSRRCDLLPQTLHSLKVSGFEVNRIFVDGTQDPLGWKAEFGVEVTARWPVIRTAGNWSLGLAELWFRHQEADRYLMAQDDFCTLPNLRQYLDRCPYPERGYWNLITETGGSATSTRKRHPASAPTNEELRVAHGRVGWFRSNQLGKGAVALVFDKMAVMALLSPVPGRDHSHFVERVMDTNRGWRAIDGGVVEQMRQKGFTEWCHSPSLVQHLGVESSMGNGQYTPAESFPGIHFDAMTFLTA